MPSYHAKLTADLDANTSGLKREMRKAQGALKQVDRSVSTLKRNLALLGAGAGIGALVAGLKSITAEGDRLTKFGERIGESVENLSALGFAADRSGVQLETMTMALQRSTRRIAEAAAGTGEARAALQELGLDASKLVEMRPSDQLVAIARAFEGVTNQADRVRLAMKLFDSEGVAMLQMLNGGEAGLRELTDRARELGGVLDTQTAQTMAEWNDSMTDASTAARALGYDLVNALGPGLVWVTEKVTALTKWIRDGLNVALLDTRRTAEWFAALTQGDITFGEWLLGDEDAVDRLEALGLLSTELRNLSSAAGEANTNLEGVFGGTTGPAKGAKTPVSQWAKDLEAAQGSLDDLAGSLLERTREIQTAATVGWDTFEAEIANVRREVDSIATRAQSMGIDPQQIDDLRAIADGYIEVRRQQQAYIDQQKEQEEHAREVQKRANALDFAFQSAFESAILSGEKLSDVLKGLAKDIAAVFLRQTITAPLASAAGGFLSSIFGGFFASGGIAPANKLSVVGEDGPEFLMPARDTAVVPAGMGGVSVTNNWDFSGANPATVLLLRQEASRIVEASKAGVLQAIEQGGGYARSVGRRT